MFRNRDDLIYNLSGLSVEVLGDPHLGKRFNAGVPIARRGEREKIVWADFFDSIFNTKAVMHVCMGDLFEDFTVDDTTIVSAAVAYKEAAEDNANTHYFILMGNHDMSRHSEKASSFRVFKEIVAPIANIHVVDEAMMFSIEGRPFGFFPYHPFKTSEEVVTAMMESWKQVGSPKLAAVFGHWDLDSFGEMPHNMFPVQLLSTMTDQAFTGHIHLPDIRNYGELELVVVGSMQPYNHSEDPAHELYVTITMDQLRAADPASLKNKCVRIVLQPGEDAPEGLDALQYITKRSDAPEDDGDIDVVLEDFDFKTIIATEMKLQGVTEPDVLSSILTEFDRLRSEEMV